MTTNAAEQTRRLAAALSPVLIPGDLIILSGDMGSGKTTFVQGLAAGLGITEHVTSPTFILMKEYHGGRYPLMHLDIYRLGRVQDVIDLGIDEALDPSYVMVVEWGDLVEPLFPQEHLQVWLHNTDDEQTRKILLYPKGEPWVSRMPRVRQLAKELLGAGEGD